MHLFRRHRLRLGRSLVGLLLLAWLMVGFQPCAVAQSHHHAAHASATHHHHGHGATMPHMSHEAAQQEKAPCAPGADCPVFKAVDGQAATKAAEPVDPPSAPLPALISSWPAPLHIPEPVTPTLMRVTRLSLPAPPILEFRVLLI